MKEREIPEEIIAQFSAADDIFKSFKTPQDQLEQVAETLLQVELPTNKAFHHSLISRLLEDSYQIDFFKEEKIGKIAQFLQRFELDLLFDSNSSNLVETCFNMFEVFAFVNKDNEQLMELYQRIFDELYANLPKLLENEYASKFIRAVYAVELGVEPESLKNKRRTHANDQILEYLHTGKCLLEAQNLSKALVKFCEGVGFQQAAKVLETSQILQLYMTSFPKIKTDELPEPCEILGEFLEDKNWPKLLEAYKSKSYDADLYKQCISATNGVIVNNESEPEILHFLCAAVEPEENAYYAGALISNIERIESLQPLELEVCSKCILNSYFHREVFLPIVIGIIQETDAILTAFDSQPIIESCFQVFAKAKADYQEECLQLVAELKETTGSDIYFIKRLLHPGAPDNAPLELETFKGNQRYNYDILKQYGDAETLRKLKKEAWVKIREQVKEQRFGDVLREKAERETGCNGFWRCGEMIVLKMLDIETDWLMQQILPAITVYFELNQEELLTLIDNPAGVDLVCGVFENKAMPFALKAELLDKLRGQYRELCFSKLGLIFLAVVGHFLLSQTSEDVALELQVSVLKMITAEISPRPVVIQLQRRKEGLDVFKTFRIEEYLHDRGQWEKGLFSSLKALERKSKKKAKVSSANQEKDDEM